MTHVARARHRKPLRGNTYEVKGRATIKAALLQGETKNSQNRRPATRTWLFRSPHKTEPDRVAAGLVGYVGSCDPILL